MDLGVMSQLEGSRHHVTYRDGDRLLKFLQLLLQNLQLYHDATHRVV